MSTSLSDGDRTLSFVVPADQSDGNYQLRLIAGAVADRARNEVAASSVLEGASVYLLAGDANRDRIVGFSDSVILAQNYNASGSTFGQGYFDYSGTVGFKDLVILAQEYGRVVEAPTAPALAPRTDLKVRRFTLDSLLWTDRLKAADILSSVSFIASAT